MYFFTRYMRNKWHDYSRKKKSCSVHAGNIAIMIASSDLKCGEADNEEACDAPYPLSAPGISTPRIAFVSAGFSLRHSFALHSFIIHRLSINTFPSYLWKHYSFCLDTRTPPRLFGISFSHAPCRRPIRMMHSLGTWGCLTPIVTPLTPCHPLRKSPR